LHFLSTGAEGDPDAEEREREEEMQRRRAEEEVSQLAVTLIFYFCLVSTQPTVNILIREGGRDVREGGCAHARADEGD
jgi:hypothetical protein